MDMSNKTDQLYNTGDYVVYGENGVCEIIDIREEDFIGLDKMSYYVLETVYSKTTIFIPTNSDVLVNKLRPVLSSADEINNLIEETEIEHEEWIEDSKKRAEYFGEMLSEGNRVDILWLIKVLTSHKKEVEEQNKRFYISDKNILTSAEKVIIEEFAFVLGIEKNEVVPYIRKRLKKQ